jgi:hypothetical protein
MNDPDIDRILRTWFSDGPIEMPDRVVVVVADRIGRQRQRRRWRLPGRLTVNSSVKPLITVAAVAVVAIAIAGVAIVSRPSGPSVGGIAPPSPTQSSSPSRSATSTPTAVASATPPWDELSVRLCGQVGCGGPLSAGTYTSKALKPAVTYTLTTDWVNLRDWPEFFQLYPDTVANRALAASGEYAPYILIVPGPTMVSPSAACQEEITTRPPDEVEVDAAGFADYLASREHLLAAERVAVTLSGLTGQQIDVGLETGWTGCLPGTPFGRPTRQTDGLRYIVLDTPDGDSLMISLWAPTDFDSFLAEAMPIVESFEFDLAN